MSLAKVVVSWDAFSPCLAHALSNEKEEIMGLLLGHVDQNNIAIIRRSLVLQRKVKKKDRVEISYESLALASTIAEQLSDADSSEGMQKQPLRILGWYHSHPHITCFPSHVDVKTQGSYQQLESAFVGLIFSVFDKGNLEICAFQALQIDSVFERIEVPLVLEHTGRQTHLQTLSTKTSLDSLLALQASLLNEDLCAFTDLQQNELRAGDCAVLSRRCLAFQSALQRKIDLQVVPLQMALRSKKMSLVFERKRLNDRLAALHRPAPSSAAFASTDAMQNILCLTTKPWMETTHVLHRALRVGIHINILNNVNSSSCIVGPAVLKLSPSNNFTQNSMFSPWVCHIGDIGIGYLIDVKNSSAGMRIIDFYLMDISDSHSFLLTTEILHGNEFPFAINSLPPIIKKSLFIGVFQDPISSSYDNFTHDSERTMHVISSPEEVGGVYSISL